MKSNVLSLPCCYFPTRIVMVDDNETLTQSLKLHLNFESQNFNDPLKALNYLSNYTPTVTEQYWLLPENESDLCDGAFIQPLYIDTGEIRSLQHDPDKYQDISVVIMDYHMPALTGLEVLSRLSDKPFKTILLTGEGDHALAVKAFNQGQIDYFLRKDEENLSEKLNQIIKQLQFEYFSNMGKRSRELLSWDYPLLSDQKTCEYFYNKIQENNIKEFYLMNLWGNYLLIDQERQKHYFCAYTQEQLNTIAENAHEANAEEKIINELTTGKKIPFFGENMPYWKVDGKNWNQYLFNPDIIKTNQGDVFVGLR